MGYVIFRHIFAQISFLAKSKNKESGSGYSLFNGRNNSLRRLLDNDDIIGIDLSKSGKESWIKEHSKVRSSIENTLKEKVSNILLQKPDIQTLIDLNNYIDGLVLRFYRVSMIIQPEFQLFLNLHSGSGKRYVVFRGLYIDQNFRKIKVTNESCGNIEKYGKDLEDFKNSAVFQEVLQKLEVKLIELYRREYW